MSGLDVIRSKRWAPPVLATLSALSAVTSASIVAAAVVTGTGLSVMRQQSSSPGHGESQRPRLSADEQTRSLELAVVQSSSLSRSGGLFVSPRGTLFRLRKLLPGDQARVTEVVRVTRKPAHGVTLSAKKLVVTTCAQNHLHCLRGAGRGSLASVLKLTIRDTTTGLTVYSGKLRRLRSSLSHRSICAAGSARGNGPKCHRPWARNETHRFIFAVTLPWWASNGYQGTGVLVRLLWRRH